MINYVYILPFVKGGDCRSASSVAGDSQRDHGEGTLCDTRSWIHCVLATSFSKLERHWVSVILFSKLVVHCIINKAINPNQGSQLSWRDLKCSFESLDNEPSMPSSSTGAGEATIRHSQHQLNH